MPTKQTARRNRMLTGIPFMQSMVRLLCFLLWFSSSGPAPIHAAVFRVAPGASVQAALDRAGPGDTVRLMPGVHRERVAFKNSGAYKKPVVLEGEPGALL